MGKRKIQRILSLSIVFFLQACSSIPAPTPEQLSGLFHDQLFSAPRQAIQVSEVLAISDEMRTFVRSEIAEQLKTKDAKQALFDALYSQNSSSPVKGNATLQLEYDASFTRNAAQTFAARSGNCMSLVLMTAALAREMNLDVQYQSVQLRPSWSRNGTLLLNAGHVNLVLLDKHTPATFFKGVRPQMTIDFLSADTTRHLKTQELKENTVIAMYMNNRAVESLASDDSNQAYWWARAAAQQDPLFLSTYNTLGAIYRAHGNLKQARAAFSLALEQEPDNTSIMRNLAMTLQAMGDLEQANILNKKIANHSNRQAYYFFNLGVKAMEKKDYATAREYFEKEVNGAPDNPEFHYHLARVLLQLGEIKSAESHVVQAINTSLSPKDTAVYQDLLVEIRGRLGL